MRNGLTNALVKAWNCLPLSRRGGVGDEIYIKKLQSWYFGATLRQLQHPQGFIERGNSVFKRGNQQRNFTCNGGYIQFLCLEDTLQMDNWSALLLFLGPAIIRKLGNSYEVGMTNRQCNPLQLFRDQQLTNSHFNTWGQTLLTRCRHIYFLFRLVLKEKGSQ